MINELIEQLKTMSPQQQSRVLEFVRNLAKTEIKGTPGQQLLRFAGCIPSDELQLMREAIEQGCEQLYSVLQVNEVHPTRAPKRTLPACGEGWGGVINLPHKDEMCCMSMSEGEMLTLSRLRICKH